jgi:translation initiation factor IF-3
MDDASLPSFRANRAITTRVVRVVDDRGTTIGTMPIYRALALADAERCDLVEIGPTYSPPVCRFMRKSLDDL